jgi:hypothetical protein
LSEGGESVLFLILNKDGSDKSIIKEELDQNYSKKGK